MRHATTSNRLNFSDEGSWSQSATRLADDTLERWRSNSTRSMQITSTPKHFPVNLTRRRSARSAQSPHPLNRACHKKRSAPRRPHPQVRAPYFWHRAGWKLHRRNVAAWHRRWPRPPTLCFCGKTLQNQRPLRIEMKRGPLLMSCTRPGPTLWSTRGRLFRGSQRHAVRDAARVER